MNLHWETLDKKRIALLPKLKFLEEQGFYLAGGTALALQIGHRRSLDFDYYVTKDFDSEKILRGFQGIGSSVVLIQKAENTLIVKVDLVDISLFAYPYKLLKKPIATEYLTLASIEDIAAMKLIAIIQRGVRRDFTDLYFLIHILGLKEIFCLTEKKYPPFNKYVALQALTYFQDAEREPSLRKTVLFKPVTWDAIKKCITAKSREFKDTLES